MLFVRYARCAPVQDNKSVNGTAVNGIKLKPLTSQTLVDGDLIIFGVKRSENVPWLEPIE